MTHFEKRLDAMDGKAMIVCMSRRICVEMYDAIIKLRLQWHGADDAKGQIKIVMSGSGLRTRRHGNRTSARSWPARPSPSGSRPHPTV